MKKHFTTLFYLVLVAVLPLSAQIGNNNRLVFVANMNGEQEVPDVATDGRGIVSFVVSEDLQSMDVHGVFSLLTGPVTSCHIHNGVEGMNGSIYFDLTDNIVGNELKATVPLPPDFIEKALGEALYFNVHTFANQNGEIRGQLELQSEVFFAAGLTGGQEVPAVTTNASGVGYVSYSPGGFVARYRFVVNGLSGAPTASHIHTGVAGMNGGVVVPLTIVSNNLIQGEIDLTTVPADFTQKLEEEGLYVNVHTAANPGGEIRGQLKSLGPIHFEALMNGDQETPPVSTTAQGVAIAGLSADLNTLNYIVGAYGLTPTAGHFHDGTVGAAGGVLVPFVAGTQSNYYEGSATVPAGMALKLLNSGVYANIHTAANPGGEIRGQMIPELRQVYAFDLCGGQEVPSTGTGAIGSAVITHDWLNTHLDYRYIVDGMTGPPTAAHIHTGPIGVSGGVLTPVNVPMPVGSGQFVIDGVFATTLLGGDTYLNVHTAANPSGEVRGQIQMGTLCTTTGTGSRLAVSNLKVFPNPASHQALLQFESDEVFSGKISMFNLMGTLVSEQPIVVQNGQAIAEINLADWPQGMYFGILKSNGGDAAVSFKLVKE